MTYFAKNLRYLRRKANLSQSDLGDRINTDYNTISRYESGKTTPKLEALSKLAEVFAVSLGELREVDLTSERPTQPAVREAVTQPVPLRYPATPLPKPARHPLQVTVELDGTAESFERAVARLAAISDVVAAIN